MTLLRSNRLNYVVLLGLSLLLAAVMAVMRLAPAGGTVLSDTGARVHAAAPVPTEPGEVGPSSGEGDWPW